MICVSVQAIILLLKLMDYLPIPWADPGGGGGGGQGVQTPPP